MREDPHRVGVDPPVQQVEVMRRLVHEEAAGIAAVGMPAAEVVGAVAGIEIPVEVGRAHLADPARRQQLADLPRGRREAVVEGDVDPPPGARLGREDAPAVRGGRRHRLLGDDVDPGLERLDDDVGMGVVAGADDQRVRPRLPPASRRGRSRPPAPSAPSVSRDHRQPRRVDVAEPDQRHMRRRRSPARRGPRCRRPGGRCRRWPADACWSAREAPLPEK